MFLATFRRVCGTCRSRWPARCSAVALLGCALALSACLRIGYDALASTEDPDGGPSGSMDAGTRDGGMDAAVMLKDGGSRMDAAMGMDAQVGMDSRVPDDEDGGIDGSIADAGPEAGVDPILGFWRGYITNDMSGMSYDVCIELTQVTQANVTGGSLAAGHGDFAVCDAGVFRESDLTYRALDAGYREFTEQVTYTLGSCEQQDGGRVFMKYDDGGLDWSWYSTSGDGGVWASSLLERGSACP